ncbi:competence protein CoiA family protein, partial [Streptomyces noursei]
SGRPVKRGRRRRPSVVGRRWRRRRRSGERRRLSACGSSGRRNRAAWGERMRQRWAEEDARREKEKAEEAARRAQERVEREERERQALETARAWWGRLSPEQIAELFAAVADYAWHESQLRVDKPEKPMMSAEYAYGVPIYVQGKKQRLYGVVRPCPQLVYGSSHVALVHVLVRSAQEARELAAVIPEGRITELGLPEHEQLTMY